MSDKSVWQEYIRDGSTGAALAGASITVTVESSGLPASIYSDTAGTPLSNPTTSDSEGLAKFYAAEGIYKIVATLGLETATLRDVQIGEAQSRDIGTVSTNVLDVAAADLRFEPITLDNPTAIVAPTINNDNTEGYSYNSTWFDTVGGDFYRCADASTGAALWFNTSVSVGTLGSLAFLDSGTGGANVRYNTAAEAFYEADLGTPSVTGHVLTSTAGDIRSWADLSLLYEALLGSPAADGYVLSSLATGARSWIPNAVVEDKALPDSRFDKSDGSVLVWPAENQVKVDTTGDSYNFMTDGYNKDKLNQTIYFSIDEPNFDTNNTVQVGFAGNIDNPDVSGSTTDTDLRIVEITYTGSTFNVEISQTDFTVAAETTSTTTALTSSDEIAVQYLPAGYGTINVYLNGSLLLTHTATYTHTVGVGQGIIRMASTVTPTTLTIIESPSNVISTAFQLLQATSRVIEFYVSHSSLAQVTKYQTTSPDANLGNSVRAQHSKVDIITLNSDTLDKYNVLHVEAQLLVGSNWGCAEFVFGATGLGTALNRYNSSDLVVQTGTPEVINIGANTGSPHSTGNLSSAPGRLLIVAEKK